MKIYLQKDRLVKATLEAAELIQHTSSNKQQVQTHRTGTLRCSCHTGGCAAVVKSMRFA